MQAKEPTTYYHENEDRAVTNIEEQHTGFDAILALYFIGLFNTGSLTYLRNWLTFMVEGFLASIRESQKNSARNYVLGFIVSE